MAVKLIKVGNGFNTPVKTYVVDDLSEINKPFYGDKAIVVNDGIYIYGEDDWYPFNADMTLGGSGGGGIADLSAIAPTWTEGTEYIEGDIVSLGGKIYTCNTSSPSRTEFKEDEWAVADSLLGAGGRLRSVYTPQGLDEIFEYDSIEDFPETGESGVIYVDTSDNSTYRYSGTTYVKIGGAGGLTEEDIAAIEGKIITDYNELDNRPIVFDKETLNNNIEFPFTKVSLTQEQYNSNDKELYTADKENKYAYWIGPGKDFTKQLETEIGDRVFAYASTFWDNSYVKPTPSYVPDGWELIHYGTQSMWHTWIYTKIATSKTEEFAINYNYGPSFFGYYSISNVKDYELKTQERIDTSTNLPTLFFTQQSGNIDLSLNQPSIVNHLRRDSGSYMYSCNVVYAGNPGVKLKSGSYTTPVSIHVTFNEENTGTDDVYKLSGTYSKIEDGTPYISDATYYVKGAVTYNGSEIATKADLENNKGEEVTEEELKVLIDEIFSATEPAMLEEEF